MRPSFPLAAATLALLLAPNCGRADYLPPDSFAWSYSFSPGAAAVYADGGRRAGVSFSRIPTRFAVGSSDLVAANLRVFSTAPPGHPDRLAKNGAYTLNMILSTADGRHTAHLTFHGRLSGFFSAKTAKVGNVFGPDFVQNVDFGSSIPLFNVQLVSYWPPGSPGHPPLGGIAAHVDVQRPFPYPSLPEPSTLLLALLGLPALGGAWQRNWQGLIETCLAGPPAPPCRHRVSWPPSGK